MAKSIKSKWKKARRQDKRIKYGQKELEQLNKLVAKREAREHSTMKYLNTARTKLIQEETIYSRTAPPETYCGYNYIPHTLSKAGRHSLKWNKRHCLAKQRRIDKKKQAIKGKKCYYLFIFA